MFERYENDLFGCECDAYDGILKSKNTLKSPVCAVQRTMHFLFV